MIGTSICFLSGACLVLKSKFSASTFWKDVRDYQCTAIQVSDKQTQKNTKKQNKNKTKNKHKHKHKQTNKK